MELSKVNPTEQRSLRETLRWATRHAHERLDSHFVAIVDPEETQVYDLFIRMNHACHEALLPLIAQSPLPRDVAGPGEPDERLAALRADMAALGLRPLVLPPFAIAAPNLQQAAGMAYVLEGSRLGSTLILRRLDEAAEAGRGERSRRYLRTSAGAAQFRALMTALATLPWDEPSLTMASDAAVATFDHFALAARLGGTPA